MLYYIDSAVTVRDLQSSDINQLAGQHMAMNGDNRIQTFYNWLHAQEAGNALALVALYRGQPAGHALLSFSAQTGPFSGRKHVMLSDVCVFEPFRRGGVGSMLISTAEKAAKSRADLICAAVPVSCGAAQRMFASHGYLPDGSGAWFNGSICRWGTPCANNDALVIYFTKNLY